MSTFDDDPVLNAFARLATSARDVLQLLTSDHELILQLFQAYGAQRTCKPRDPTLARDICALLEINSAVEENLIYPFAEREMGPRDVVLKAQDKRTRLRRLVQRVARADATEPRYDISIARLQGYFERHVLPAERELFNSLRQRDPDFGDIRAQVHMQKLTLMASEHIARNN